MTDKQNPTVLLVDDEPVGRRMLEKILQGDGYTVIWAENGPRARELAIGKQPDIILLDIIMPEEDGFEVIDLLHKNPKTTRIPVIFLTGRDDLEDKMRGFELGAVDYITKPYNGLEVLARVRLHLKLSLATNSLIAAQAERLRQIQDAQTSMLVKPADVPDALFGVYYMAFLEAGGDFYDVFRISDGIYGYFVADISGHDIATSYITSALKALLKQYCASVYQPAESMTLINTVLEDVLPEGKYLTACYAKLNRGAKCLSIVNGGHLPAVYLPKDDSARLIEAKGDVIGIFRDVCFETLDIKVENGDRFFLYSDGLIEKPGERKLWTKGLDDLLEKCEELRDVPISESAVRLKDMFHNGKSGLEDDIVVLGIEV